MPPDKRAAELEKKLDRSNVKIHPHRGFEYVGGEYVIQTANRIFGYEGWSYHITKDPHVIFQAEPGEFGKGDVWSADVHVQVGESYREDTGTNVQAGGGPSHIEMSYKGCVTDALKRAFRTYGDQFGLSLYFDDPEFADEEEQPPPAAEKPVSQPKERAPDWDRGNGIPQSHSPRKATKKGKLSPESQMLKEACEAQDVKPVDVGRVLKDLYPDVATHDRFIAWAEVFGGPDPQVADVLALTVRVMVDDKIPYEKAKTMAMNALDWDDDTGERIQKAMDAAKGPESGVADSDHEGMPEEFPDDATDDDPEGD